MRDFKVLVRFAEKSENLSRYFSEVMKEKMLDAKAEAELAVKALEGDQEAKNKIVLSNLRFVISVAKAYANKNAPLEDLISEGNKGLIEAIETFDPTTGFKFISYAVWHIRKNIFYYLNFNSRIVKLPGNVINEMKKYQSIEDAFITQFGREPSVEEILDVIENNKMESLRKGTIDLIKNKPVTVSLESSGNPDDEYSKAPIDWLHSEDSSENFADENDDKLKTSSLLSFLTPKEREMIELKYGLNGKESMNLAQIGRHFGRTNEWARLNINKIERKMKIIARKKNL
jgi:RNA polymerase primary sigma factor